MEDVTDLTGLIGFNLEDEEGVWSLEWFSDWEELADHLFDHAEDLVDDRAEEMEEILDEVDSQDQLMKAVPALSAILTECDWTRFWVGTVEDLMNGSSEVEKFFRKTYWNFARQIESDAVIPEKSKQSFKAYYLDNQTNE